MRNTKDRDRIQFVQGDGCNLPQLGEFGCVFIANTLHHLPTPMTFLDRMPHIIVPGGLLVIADFYIWNEDHLPKVNYTVFFFCCVQVVISRLICEITSQSSVKSSLSPCKQPGTGFDPHLYSGGSSSAGTALVESGNCLCLYSQSPQACKPVRRGTY